MGSVGNFDFVPVGTVKLSYAWSSKDTTFENGSKQYRRTRVKSKKTMGFTINGHGIGSLEKFIDFYNNQFGQLNPFWFTYDGVKELCYFSDTISPKIHMECGKIVGFECDVSLEVDDQSTSYSTPSEDDVLPSPHGNITRSIDWNIQVLELGATGRRAKSKKPIEKLTCSFSGLKKDRDKIISLFNSHCKTPLILRYNGKDVKVKFPDSLEITDKREGTNIVGYECQIELEVV